MGVDKVTTKHRWMQTVSGKWWNHTVTNGMCLHAVRLEMLHQQLRGFVACSALVCAYNHWREDSSCQPDENKGRGNIDLVNGIGAFIEELDSELTLKGCLKTVDSLLTRGDFLHTHATVCYLRNVLF